MFSNLTPTLTQIHCIYARWITLNQLFGTQKAIVFINKEIQMKTTLTLLALLTSLASTSWAAPKQWTFTYKPKSAKSFPLTFAAETKADAFKLASKACFQKLTNGQYPGEEKGLEYIDVCANPKM